MVPQRLSTLTFLLILLGTTWFAAANPATCACGAQLPHPHLWFEVPGHHHHDGPAGRGEPFSRVDLLDRPQLSIPASSIPVGTAVPMIVLVSFLLILLLACERIHERSRHPPTGQSVRPPVPPPRFDTVRG